MESCVVVIVKAVDDVAVVFVDVDIACSCVLVCSVDIPMFTAATDCSVDGT